MEGKSLTAEQREQVKPYLATWTKEAKEVKPAVVAPSVTEEEIV